MALWLAAFIGALQGMTELFPVSSLGHALVVPALLHLDFDPTDDSFVPFLVLLHLGTAGALLVLYWREWQRLVVGFVRASLRGRVADDCERTAMMIVVGSIPTGLLGFFLEKPLKSLFGHPRAAAAFLLVNAGILFGAEQLRRRRERAAAATDPRLRQDHEAGFAAVEGLSMRAALLVGTCQALALLPGISRSGVTMAGGLAAGLRHQEAARFSFLLATPIILAAGLLEVPELFRHGVPLGTYLVATAITAALAYLSARFLLRYLRFGRLDPFAGYCAVLGGVALLLTR